MDGQRNNDVARNTYDCDWTRHERIAVIGTERPKCKSTHSRHYLGPRRVAYRGARPIPDSVEAFRIWHARGVPYAFVTNNSTKSAAQFAAKLAGMGIPATAPQVFNTISAVEELLRLRWTPGTPVFAIGEAPLLRTLHEAGYRLTGTDAEVVILGFDSNLSYAKLRTAVRAALAGATIIAANSDLLTPVHDGYDPCVGVLTAAVTAAVPNAIPIVVGKPHPFMIEQALAYIGTTRNETVMIGDQVATDVIAGQRAGLRSVLLAGDIPFNSVADVVPDRVISSLLDLVDTVSVEGADVS
jgi:4-nitrophenyl phosphatase